MFGGNEGEGSNPQEADFFQRQKSGHISTMNSVVIFERQARLIFIKYTRMMTIQFPDA